jgi:hypothetical protein
MQFRKIDKGDLPMKKTLIFAAALLLAASTAFAQAHTASGTTTLSLVVGNEANIAITNSTTNLSTSATTFSDYTGTTNFKYQVRTSSGGSGSITVLITTDFSAGGPGLPSVQTPPTAGDTLTFTCTAAVGSACSSAQTASTTVAATAISFGANAHAGAPGAVTNGADGSVIWSLTNDPAYAAGTYTAVATFTISAT